ncbi:hypothetical protein AD998_17115 [bacterium 336/3]|nr:hypothetical protein AD998_17115 [bacterium 336/3]
MKSNFKLLLLLVLLCGANKTVAQINLGKAKDKIGLGKKKEEPKKVETKSTEKANTTKVSDNQKLEVKTSVLDEVKKQRAGLEKENKVKIDKYEDGKSINPQEIPNYLTFTNDFEKPVEDKIEFGGKDFIYARLKLAKKITEYLPQADYSGLQYYRVKIYAKLDDGAETESDLKLSKMTQFKMAYDKDEILFPIVPDKAFYENILDKYRKNEKFPNPMEEQKAYQTALAYNMPWEIVEMLQKAENGQHKVEILIAITAKLKGSDFAKISNMKGLYAFTMDDETRERYQNAYNLMSEYKLSNEYWGYESIAGQTISEAKEAEMLKNMSPRDRERYQTAKRSPDGYMAAYKGAKASITFSMDASRNKPASIDVIWSDGGAGKEAGSHTVRLRPNTTRTVTHNIPVGAKVSINGRVLIASVQGNQNIPIYWWY